MSHTIIDGVSIGRSLNGSTKNFLVQRLEVELVSFYKSLPRNLRCKIVGDVLVGGGRKKSKP